LAKFLVLVDDDNSFVIGNNNKHIIAADFFLSSVLFLRCAILGETRSLFIRQGE
jgi:hypothetical protein